MPSTCLLYTSTERQSAVQSMVEMTELVEKESATELLLEAKGFTDVVVNLTGETADIVVPMKEVTEEQRAQIEDIVTRKTGIGVENIVITPMSSAADTAAEAVSYTHLFGFSWNGKERGLLHTFQS